MKNKPTTKQFITFEPTKGKKGSQSTRSEPPMKTDFGFNCDTLITVPPIGKVMSAMCT